MESGTSLWRKILGWLAIAFSGAVWLLNLVGTLDSIAAWSSTGSPGLKMSADLLARYNFLLWPILLALGLFMVSGRRLRSSGQKSAPIAKIPAGELPPSEPITGRHEMITIGWVERRLLTLGYPLDEVRSLREQCAGRLREVGLRDTDSAGRFFDDTVTQEDLRKIYLEYFPDRKRTRADRPIVDPWGLVIWGPTIHRTGPTLRASAIADVREQIRLHAEAGAQ